MRPQSGLTVSGRNGTPRRGMRGGDWCFRCPDARTRSARVKSNWPGDWTKIRTSADYFCITGTYGRFTALYTWATSLILLFITYIDFAFPDPAWRTSYYALEAALSNIRASLAALIVSFPIFLILWRFLLREVQRHPEKAKGAIRRWLGYLSLFVGAVTLSADAITFVYYLFEGQLTVRFLLKVTVLFLIAGGLVYYLAFTLRSETETE